MQEQAELRKTEPEEENGQADRGAVDPDGQRVEQIRNLCAPTRNFSLILIHRREKVDEEFRNPRNLAAFELWRLFGEPMFHDNFLATTVLGQSGNPMEQHKAVISYARLPDETGDAALRDAARQWIVQMADSALTFADGNAFGVTTSIPQLPPMGFVGYLSTPEMIGAILPHAWLLTHDNKYLAGAVRACGPAGVP